MHKRKPPPLGGGGGPSAKRLVEGVNTDRKHTLTPLRSSLSDGKDNKEQRTRVSLHLLEGEGDRAPTAHGGRGKYGSQTYSYAAQEFPLG